MEMFIGWLKELELREKLRARAAELEVTPIPEAVESLGRRR